MNTTKMYFYTNKEVLFDYLTRNTISPNCVVKDSMGCLTISTESDLFLFVTHKKLNRETRGRGITDLSLFYPITLEFSIQGNDEKAILVSKNEEKYEYRFESLSNYDEEHDIGAYIIGEIPLSRIEKIYFDTKEEMDMFFVPSPDCWYPTEKYAILPDSFSEELSFESCNVNMIAEASGEKLDEIINDIRFREKYRAALLNFVDYTKAIKRGNYSFNMDEEMRTLFRVPIEEIYSVLPHYSTATAIEDNYGRCPLIRPRDNNDDSYNSKLYNDVFGIFARQPYNPQKSPETMLDVIDSLNNLVQNANEIPQEANDIQSALINIKKVATDTSDNDAESIMLSIPDSVCVLRALLFVVKNPNNYDLFTKSLDVYHADAITKRDAATLWGALNGLFGMPGKGHNKENQHIWQFVEAFVCSLEYGIKPSLSVDLPEVRIINGTLLGIALKEERIITHSDVRGLVLSLGKSKLTSQFYKKLLEVANNETHGIRIGMNKKYVHNIASVDLPSIKIGDELNNNTKKLLEKLLTDCSTPVPNKEKLFKDYIEDEKKFESVFNKDKVYWKRFFVMHSEGKDD